MSLSVWSSILFFFFDWILPHHHVPAGNSDENPNANPPLRGAPAEKLPTEHDLCGQGGWRWFKSWTSVESCCGKSLWQRGCWELSASLDTVNWEEIWRWTTPTILLQKAIGLLLPMEFSGWVLWHCAIGESSFELVQPLIAKWKCQRTGSLLFSWQLYFRLQVQSHFVLRL